MKFRKGQMILTKKADRLKPEYRNKAGIILKIHKNYLTVKFHKASINSTVIKEDVAQIL